MQIAQAHIVQDLELGLDLRNGVEELESLRARHLEDIGNVLALVADIERLAIVAPALADVALDEDIGQKVHLDALHAVALAGLAAAALDVEGITAGAVA